MNELKTPARRPLEPVRRAIVIGASSGIGAALARRLALQGYRVALLARRSKELRAVCDAINLNFAGEDASRALAYPHDVTDYDAVPALFQEMVRDLGGLDLIAYVAAVQHPTEFHEYNFEKDAEMIRVNLLGAMAWLNQAAARFDRARSGTIVGVSSIAGERGRVAGPAYGTSKAALNTYLEALRNRLSRRGVTVLTVKPGFVETRLLANAAKTMWVISPEDAAAQIDLAIRRGQQTVYIPARWRYVGLIIRHIPSVIFRRLKI